MSSHAALTVVGAGLAQVSDDELLRNVCRLVGQSNRVLAALLAHLAEVEARGLHRVRACASLSTYCIYELRMSEDTAFRRVAASRLVARFPLLLEAIERGEIHLTGLLLLGPHLTEANVVEVMALAKHRTKKEILGLVRRLSPVPDVPSRIEVLGPAQRKAISMNPSWSDFVGSMCPVRELRPGERQADWLVNAEDLANESESDVPETAPARSELPETTQASMESANDEPARSELTTDGAPSPECASRRNVDHDRHPTPSPLSGPQRYGVQFTASEEYVKLVEEAQALLSHAVPSRDLAEVHLRAMRTLVAELKKRKYAVLTAKEHSVRPSSEAPVREGSVSEASVGERSGDEAHSAETPLDVAHAVPLSARRRGRHIPAAVRRAVFARDGGRCSYVDALGTRCRETARLEFHHEVPFSRDGGHAAANLHLRCTQHNTLAAEDDFGREFVTRCRSSEPHARWGDER